MFKLAIDCSGNTNTDDTPIKTDRMKKSCIDNLNAKHSSSKAERHRVGLRSLTKQNKTCIRDSVKCTYL